MFTFCTRELKERYRSMLRELEQVVDVKCSDCEGEKLNVTISKESPGIVIERTEDGFRVTLQKECLFSRAVGLIYEDSEKDRKEVAIYQDLEIMIDCSRNAVITPDAFRRFVRHAALMGYTAIQLYTEDTFEVEGQPYFGYQRGAYTAAELREMDCFCEKFGIELVPCIQTLAHLGKVLKWKCYEEITDFDDILLVGSEDTYKFIEAMVKTMSENIKSRRINIGMDEAHMLGLGKYLDRYGYQDRLKIMLEHFKCVKEILDRYSYCPMMWSDMFFRLQNNGEYTNQGMAASQEIRSLLTEDVELIYWDYHTLCKEEFDSMFKSHLAMSSRISYAAGAWKWTGFSPYNSYSLRAGREGHKSCMEHGINRILVTAWGDDGGEASLYSVLPVFQLWAEQCFHSEVEDELLAARFRVCVGAEVEDFMRMDQLILTPENPIYSNRFSNPSKYIFYQDVLMGMFEKHITAATEAHYRTTAKQLADCARRTVHWSQYFTTLSLLSEVLSTQCSVMLTLRSCYQKKDMEGLHRMAEETLPLLLEQLELFSDSYYQQWIEENKIWGFERFDLRTGGLRRRIERARRRIVDFLEGRIGRIEELEIEPLYFDCRTQDGEALATDAVFYSNIASPAHERYSKSY